MEFAVLGLFCGILILCIVCNVSIIYALLAGFVIFGCYAKKKDRRGVAWRKLRRLFWLH